MTSFQVLQNHPAIFIGLIGLLGLLVGSFLNVVAHRVPVMMHKAWRKECLEYLEMDKDSEPDNQRFDLIKPDSHCPTCHHAIKSYENIPIISYIVLKGRCANCNTRISLRYPAVELFTALTSAIIAWNFGYGLQTAFALLLNWGLISASLIDLDHQLLPDSVTLPLLWLGLFISLFGIFTDSRSSIIGAISGWLAFWLVYIIFKCITGKEGMGFGDFKLLAALGAWLGWQVLPAIVLLSSFVGAIVGITMMVFFNHTRSVPIPFGPYLASAGWIALLWGEDLNNYYLSLAF